jgi:glutathione S-transferase
LRAGSATTKPAVGLGASIACGILTTLQRARYNTAMTIIMHDLAGADPALRFSPYCWRIRFALAHKGLPVDTIAWRFTDKAAIAFSGQERVPVIRDGDTVVSDSWAIAEYLDKQYATPTLFGGAAGHAHARFLNAWADSAMLGGIVRLIVRDILDVVDAKDRDYFRMSREARFGMPLEDVQAGREGRVSGFRETVQPLRLVLRQQNWLGGAAPSYADFIVAGTLMWPRCCSRFALLEKDDPLNAWFERILELFGGLGRAARRP